MKNLINNDMAKNLSIILGIGLFMFLVTKTFAVSSPFRPSDQELDPSCAPGDPFCYVTRDKDLYKENASGTITNTTSGTNAIVIGKGGTASGAGSIAIGQEAGLELGPISSGDYSLAFGNAAIASGDYSLATAGATASGDNSVSMGWFSNVAGNNAFGIGYGILAPSFREVALGSYPTSYTPSSATAWSATDRLLNIGNGSSSGSRSDAFTVLKNGNIGIGDSTPSYILDINGTGAIKLPVGTTAQRPASLTAGLFRYNSTTSGAEVYTGSGWTTLGSGGGQTFNLIKEADESTVTAEVRATGTRSVAIGDGVNAPSYGQISMGSFTSEYIPASGEEWNTDDPILVVGNGANSDVRSNALVVGKGGGVAVGPGVTVSDVRGKIFYVKGSTSTVSFNDELGQWDFTSDRNLKENIMPLEYGLDEILSLEPKSFNYTGSNRETLGFIAQDVQGIIPEIVSQSSNGTYSMSTEKVVPVLVAAVQELAQRVEDLEDELNVTPTPKETPEEPAEETQEEVISEEGVVEEEVPAENPAPEGGEGEVLGAYVDASNQMNLTNLLLMTGILLLVINLIVTMKKQD